MYKNLKKIILIALISGFTHIVNAADATCFQEWIVDSKTNEKQKGPQNKENADPSTGFFITIKDENFAVMDIGTKKLLLVITGEATSKDGSGEKVYFYDVKEDRFFRKVALVINSRNKIIEMKQLTYTGLRIEGRCN